MAASRIEADIDFTLAAGADYIILDGRCGGTGSAPTSLRDFNPDDLTTIDYHTHQLTGIAYAGVQ